MPTKGRPDYQPEKELLCDAELFYAKIEDYLKRNNFIVLQPEVKTKLIRPTTDGLNVKTQIFLDRRLLPKERFEDLL